MNFKYNTYFLPSWNYIYMLLLIYILITFLKGFLPTYGIDLPKIYFNDITYYNYNFKRILDTNSISNKTENKQTQKSSENRSKLKDLILKAVYSKKNHQGWIIMQNNITQKTYLLEYGDIFDNYKLIEIYRTFVVFEQNGQEFHIEFKKSKLDDKYDDMNLIKKNTNHNGMIQIPLQTIKKYTKNMSKIFQDIHLEKFVQDNVTKGFSINQINKDSLFAKMGLTDGDIIQKVNKVALLSNDDIFKIYKEFKTAKILNIIILRNNIQMELNYEIY